jgi:hypothetical protein
LNVNVYVNEIYESSDVTSETNDVTPEKMTSLFYSPQFTSSELSTQSK